MREVCFIADVAVLPRWLRVRQALDYCQGVHPRFDRSIAAGLPREDRHPDGQPRARALQGHGHAAAPGAHHGDRRAAAGARRAHLGLDLLYRRKFYDTLLNDYFDKERTILLTTHQVEEVENLFTDVIFINHGQVALAASVEELGERYKQLTTTTETAPRARALQPFYEREVFGRVAMLFEGRTAAELGTLGELRTPSIADLFVAKMAGSAST